MKFLFTTLWVLVSCSTGSVTQKTIFKVSTTEEFLRTLGSDRVIELAPGLYRISDYADRDLESESVRFVHSYVDAELTIRGVENLTLRGEGGRVEIVAEPTYGNVLSFENCHGLTLQNLEIGHGPERGFCTGGVIRFDSSSSLSIKNCRLYGSGTEGILANSVQRLTVENTTIEECTYNIMSLSSTSEAVFRSCVFVNNESAVSGMINLFESPVRFEKCVIRGNGRGTAASLFEADPQSLIQLTDCVIQENVTPLVFNVDAVVKTVRTVIVDNGPGEDPCECEDDHDEPLWEDIED